MTTIGDITKKILEWQQKGGTLDVSRGDLDRLVKEQFDEAMQLIASITDLQQPQQKDQITYEAETIQEALLVYEKSPKDQRWEYLKTRFETLVKTGLLNVNISRDLAWRFN